MTPENFLGVLTGAPSRSRGHFSTKTTVEVEPTTGHEFLKNDQRSVGLLSTIYLAAGERQFFSSACDKWLIGCEKCTELLPLKFTITHQQNSGN